ncbi:MAG: hypothetical protein PVI30_25805 [Myxococcales bacterium]|jgi:hypothetical protein
MNVHERTMLALAVVGLGLAGCVQDEKIDDPALVEEVEQHPRRFEGERVTLHGEVDRVYSDRAFELEGLAPLFDDTVLVLTRIPVQLGPEKVRDDLLTTVSGTVYALDEARVEAALGRKLDAQVLADWRGKATVIADEVAAIEPQARWNEKSRPHGEVLSLWALYRTPAPMDYVDAHIDLTAVQVARRSASGFWIGFGGKPDLFVAPQTPALLERAEPESRVNVAGTLRALPPLDEATKRWKLDDADRASLAQSMLYVDAEEITPVAPPPAGPGAPGEPTAAR